MGLRDWLDARGTVKRLETSLRREYDIVARQASELRDLNAQMHALREQLHLAERRAEAAELAASQHAAEKRLLVEMIEDRQFAHAALVATREVNTVLERHNATYQATTEWAVAHINALTIERGAFIDTLKRAAVEAHPTPLFEMRHTESPMEAPPPGPIALSGVVGGVPIPEGKTAGDVINEMRARREREASQRPIDAGELLKQSAALFEEEATEGATDEPPPTDPFSEIP